MNEEKFETCDLLVAYLDDKGRTPLLKEEYEQVVMVWDFATKQAEAEARIKVNQLRAELEQVKKNFFKYACNVGEGLGFDSELGGASAYADEVVSYVDKGEG